MGSESKKSFRWYDFYVYGENSKKISEELKAVYSALFEMIEYVAAGSRSSEMMEYATDGKISFERIVEFAEQKGREKQNGTLEDILKTGYNLDQYDKKEVSSKAKEKLDEMIQSGAITKSEGAILEAYLQSFAAYGIGARDNVVTSATLLATGSMNARIGCGQGKTDISKAFAMAKHTAGNRTIITSSTPELAAQSFEEGSNSLRESGLNAIYLSDESIEITTDEKDKDGKYINKTIPLKELSPEQIKRYIAQADVVISDLTSLIKHKENGLYVPNKQNDVLLQDEQDADIFNNLWDIEIKGDAYDKDTHEKRIEARVEAAKVVAKLGDLLKGDKISQSISINGKSPEFKVNGNSIEIVGTNSTMNVPEGFDASQIEEFLLDAMLASKVFEQAGKDYVLIDGEIKAISPATGSREDIPEGVLQAIAVNECSKGNLELDGIQDEFEIKKTVSKLSLLKEGFSQICGMSATYGQIGSKVSREFLEALAHIGISPDLIPVQEIFKAEGLIPNFENIQEGNPPQENLTIGDASIKKEKVELTINGVKVQKEVSPHIAAIIRDIEAHPNEAIIIGTDDREKTIEITKALQEVYENPQAEIHDKEGNTIGYEDAIKGYSGVSQENGNPKLFAPPNPANDQKLNITPPRIIIGDHSIGRGVTPTRDKSSKTEEHLIIAQMPSRSEALLEQFLGRVGRKKNNGSVSFVLSSDDGIVQEYAERKGKLPSKATEIISEVYQEKTKHALESTKSDIELSRISATRKFNVLTTLMATALMPGIDVVDISQEKLEEAGKIAANPEHLAEFLKNNPSVVHLLEVGEQLFDKQIAIYAKQYKNNPKDLHKVQEAMHVTVIDMALAQTQHRDKSQSMSKEIAGMTMDSRYENITRMIVRAKELSDIYQGKDAHSQDKDTEEIKI